MQLADHTIGKILIVFVRFYQLVLSPLFAKSCRFHPSCSAYCIQAITKYGALKGLLKAGWRILRCNPLSPGGYDPV
ncbi:MAG: membrane protein insertion efficiency factor YidD [Calditrichaeota bacterium]|nr:MAG: membrane protein insertion efficiency factor YidD [Calditrichota bacterium]